MSNKLSIRRPSTILKRRRTARSEAKRSIRCRTVVVLGATKCGKTSFLRRLLFNQFTEDYTTTLEDSYKSHTNTTIINSTLTLRIPRKVRHECQACPGQSEIIVPIHSLLYTLCKGGHALSYEPNSQEGYQPAGNFFVYSTLFLCVLG